MHLAQLSAPLDPAFWVGEGSLGIFHPNVFAEPLAYFLRGNVASWPGPRLVNSGEPQLLWSGWLGESPTGTSPQHWTRSARQSLATACAPLASNPARIFLIPHHAHLLSDLPGCIAHALAARDAAAAGCPSVGIALAPTALLAPSMMDRAMDHLERIISMIAPLSPFVLIERIGDRRVDGAATGALLRQHMRADSTLVLAGDPAELSSWLALAPP